MKAYVFPIHHRYTHTLYITRIHFIYWSDSHFEYAYKAVKFPIFFVLLTSTKFQEYNIISIHKCITDGSKKHSIDLCIQISRVNQLSPWDLVIFPEFTEWHRPTRSPMLRWTKLEFVGNTESLVFIWALNYILVQKRLWRKKIALLSLLE